jgi:hypothetical protein
MVTFVAGAWQKAVKLLQECSTKQTGSTEAEAAFSRMYQALNILNKTPTPPKAVKKKLVQQLQVG